ncbi:hypothetical protein [Pedobacter metabolipauper]|uniref:Uncharacterized protein n=1 Tax=Pedobacter metabolipauper TaxID=425513 RepID=A0A4R6SVY8_9SPHI|nr:hypothetical protein [Pedobacter metabolipauper]TDQ10078.1 hypothetical protein ATK78_2237 [Pedobacter metabolipauper]
MKAICLLSLLTITLYSCSQGPKHPQADLISQPSATSMTAQSIVAFSDSVDAGLSSQEKHTSLIYSTGDNLSTYVEEYSSNGSPVLFKEYINNETISNTVKQYYFKNDTLVLIKESSKRNKDRAWIFTDIRTYLRNNITFKKESRSAPSFAALKSQPYTEVKADANAVHDDLTENIRSLKDAVNGKNKYEMIFNEIISSPDERYIVLKGNMQNGYSASIRIKEKDQLIDSILKDPSVFKDEKLALKWEIVDNEAVYVPVAAKVTSAKGLKR